MTNHNKQKLQEQLLAEFDALDKLGRGIGRTVGAGAKAIGSVAGGVAGLGSAIKKGYQAGKQTVGGGGADVNKQQGNITTQKTSIGDKVKGAIGKGLRNINQVANYDYTKGTQTQQDIKGAQVTAQSQADAQGAEYQRQLAKQQKQTVGTQSAASKGTDPISQAMAKGGAQDAQKRQKTGGRVAGQTSQTASAQYQRDRRAAKKAGGSAVSQGISQAQKDAANQGIANMKKQAGQTATKVPGQKQPSATAKDVGKKAGVTTAKIGGQKVDLNDPKMKNLRAAIEKAAPGVIGGVDKLQPADKAKLKKAIA